MENEKQGTEWANFLCCCMAWRLCCRGWGKDSLLFCFLSSLVRAWEQGLQETFLPQRHLWKILFPGRIPTKAWQQSVGRWYCHHPACQWACFLFPPVHSYPMVFTGQTACLWGGVYSVGTQMPGSPRGLGGAFIISLVFILYLSSTKMDA